MRYATPFDLSFNVRVEAVNTGEDPVEAFVVHDRRQTAVGQGGFHMGALRLRTRAHVGSVGRMAAFGKADFLYVYDCGSEPKRFVDREIDALLSARSGRPLNMLFLSHFDRDHICGTPRLLSKRRGLKVDTVVLPFIGMDERIIALARLANATLVDGDKIDGTIVDMVEDPVGFWSDRARQVVFVRSPDDESDDGLYGEAFLDGEDVILGPPDGEAVQPMTWKLTPIADGAETKCQRLTDPQRRPYFVVSGAAFSVSAKMDIALGWKLAPYVRPTSRHRIATFRRCVERRLDWGRGTFRRQISQPNVIRDMITRSRTGLARAYADAFGDKNLTSLCLYSGPENPQAIDAWPLAPRLNARNLTRIGWFGTGDAHLRATADIADFQRHYATDLKYASTFLLPHHGSLENSHPDRLISDADVFAASAEPVHDWPHPHPDLESAVVRRGSVFRHVRRARRSALDESFLILPRRQTGTELRFTRVLGLALWRHREKALFRRLTLPWPRVGWRGPSLL